MDRWPFVLCRRDESAGRDLMPSLCQAVDLLDVGALQFDELADGVPVAVRAFPGHFGGAVQSDAEIGEADGKPRLFQKFSRRAIPSAPTLSTWK